ncbi:MAG: hypothetical protein JKY48_16100, partial [Flavobacteriales bacterium]|nr:hypothetical protein [Flavobacteriales bacterium]
MLSLNRFITKYFFFIILACSILILGYLFLNLKDTEESLIKSAFIQQEKELTNRLNSFFKPIENHIKIASQSGSFGNYHPINIQQFNKNFIPLIEKSSAISALMMANQQGEELMLMKGGNEWYSRKTALFNNKLKSRFYKILIENKKITSLPIGDSTRISNYDPKSRPWFIGANNSEEDVFWTSPYRFFTTGDIGITISKKWKLPSGETNIFAFDVLLKDLCKFTTKLKLDENGKVFILTKDHLMLSLPNEEAYSSLDSIKKYLLHPIEQFPLPLYRKIGKFIKQESQLDYFSFNLKGEKWIGSIRPFQLKNQIFYLGEVILKSDFHSKLRSSRILILAGLVLIILFMISMIRGYRQKRRSNIQLKYKQKLLKKKAQQIREQRDLIQEAHAETTDSIRYAKRVQEAALSSKELKAELFPQSFVLLIPKDIVSGDFYWYTEHKGKKLIAAIDCTGHGVPGALMSMLGTTLLGEIVEKNGIIDPASILNELRRLIILSLKQSETSTQNDGMDMAL